MVVTLALIYPATTIAFSAPLTVLIPNDDSPTRPQRSWYCQGQKHAMGVPGFDVAAVGGFPRRQDVYIPVDCVSFAPHKRHLASSAPATLLQSF